MFESFSRWLKGGFVCASCGREYHAMSFGFGEIICPECYKGEEDFISLDKGYWLNRMLACFIHQSRNKLQKSAESETLSYTTMAPLEIIQVNTRASAVTERARA